MKIIVTQKHIDNAVGGSTSCPIALAVGDILPGRHINVGYHSIVIQGVGAYELSPHARVFVQRFDKGGRWLVKPFAFNAEPL